MFGGAEGLIEHVEALPDRPTAEQLERLRETARATETALIAATQDADYVVNNLVARIARLEALIREYALARHWKDGAASDEHCTCEGCELLQEMDGAGISLE